MTPPPSFLELDSPFAGTCGILRLLEPCGSRKEDIRERLFNGEYNKPFVMDDGETRSLYFSYYGGVQSSMKISEPFALDVAYTRKMMAFLLFKPQPENILMLGLGGGSLAKFCYHHLPAARITVVEIDPAVTAFREQFLIPQDDERFRVIHGDGVAYMAAHGPGHDTDHGLGHDQWGGGRSDVILVDAFDFRGLAPTLVAPDFYDNALRSLSPGGVLVANLVGGKRECRDHVNRIRATFGQRAVAVPVMPDGNIVVFAFESGNFRADIPALNRISQELKQRFDLEFPALRRSLEARPAAALK
jgi:spermidine synthase